MAAVPIAERLEVDQALIQERPPLTASEAVYAHFELSQRYGIDREAFEHYAQCVREVYAIGYADRLAHKLLSADGPAGREAPMDLMTHRLARRIARVLADDDEISVSELARLATSAASLRRAVTQAEKQRVDRKDEGGLDAASSRLHRAVREVYGLDPSAGRASADQVNQTHQRNARTGSVTSS